MIVAWFGKRCEIGQQLLTDLALQDCCVVVGGGGTREGFANARLRG
jgi:hypothetical protein